MSLIGLNSTYFGINSDYMDSLFTFSSGSGTNANSLNFDTSLYTNLSSFSVRNLRNLLKTSQIYDSGSMNSKNLTASAELKSGASDLKKAVDSLMTKGTESVFNSYSGISSNTDVISSATTKGLASKNKTMTVDVKQIAESQRNTGNVLDSASKAALGAGSYTFEVDYQGKKTNVSFSLTDRDTNESMNNKIASAINQKNIGITAQINKSGGQTFLTIEGSTTGEKNKDGSENYFSIMDKYGGKAVSGLGLDNVTRQAQNAVYSVNGGVDRESAVNTVNLDYNTQATLKSVSSESITLKFDYNKSAISSGIKNFADKYNSLMHTLTGSYNSKMNDLADQLDTITRSNRYALEKVGITSKSDGTLSIDSEKLSKADGNTLKGLFGGPGSYADRIGQKANTISSNAVRYGTDSYSTYGSNYNYNTSYLSGSLFNNFF